MLMKRTIIILSVCILGSMATVAQDKLSPREILDRTSEAMQGMGAITASFTTTTFLGTTPQDSISGTMDVLGEKYVMKTPEMSTWFNGRDQWNLVNSNNEVTLVTPNEDELQVASPMAFLGIYKKGFNLSSKNAELRGRKIWDVTLRPKKRKQEPSIITISIDRQTFVPMCIRIRNEGNWTRISIADFKSGANLSASHFNYPAEEYPLFEVIDMR